MASRLWIVAALLVCASAVGWEFHPFLFASRYWGRWHRRGTFLLRATASQQSICACWPSRIEGSSDVTGALRTYLCPPDDQTYAKEATCDLHGPSTKAAVEANGRVISAPYGSFSARTFGNITFGSYESDQAPTHESWAVSISLIQGPYLGTSRLRSLSLGGVGSPTSGLLMNGSFSVVLTDPSKTTNKNRNETIRDIVSHFWMQVNSTVNRTRPLSHNNGSEELHAIPQRNASVLELEQQTDPDPLRYVGKGLRSHERSITNDCVVVGLGVGSAQRVSSDGSLEHHITREETVIRSEQGTLHEAAGFRMALAVLCRIPAPDASSSPLRSGNWTAFIAILEGHSDAELEDGIYSSERLFIVCFAIGALLATKAFCQLSGVLHNSTAAQGKVAYGTMLHLVASCVVWFGTFNMVASWRHHIFRPYQVVYALLYLTTNGLQISNLVTVRRAHIALRIRSLAGLSFWQHVIGIVVCALALVELGETLFTPSFVLITQSFFVPQIWHNIVEGHSPGIPIGIALQIAVAQLAFILPFLLGPVNLLLLQPQPLSVALLVAWLGLQIFTLRRQERFGPSSIVPWFLRPHPHQYNVKLADIKHLAPEGEECPICRGGLAEPDPDSSSLREPNEEVTVWLTPCGHVFHRHCLQRWLDERFECPMCRSRLPKP